MNRLTLLSMLAIVVLVVAAVLIWVMSEQDRDDLAQSPANSTESPAASGSEPLQEVAGAVPPAESASPEKPSFDVVRINPSGDAVIAGRAAPGASVTVLDQGKAIGSIEADENGEWVFLPGRSLEPGEHKLTLSSKAPGVAAETPSDSSVVVLVPQVAKDIAGQTTDVPAGALAVEVPAKDGGAVRILNLPTTAEGGEAAASLTIDAVEYGEEGSASFSGRAPANSRLIAYLNNQPVADILAGDNGHWSVEGATPIGNGPHRFRLDLVDGKGKVMIRAEIMFELAKPQAIAGLADQTSQDVVVVQPGQNLWLLARRAYGAGTRFTIIFDANRSQIADPDLIYPGQVLELPPG